MRVSRRRTAAPATPTYTPRARAEGELPTLAVITMVRDEGTMIRRWVDWYSGQVGSEHLVVIDDNSSDGSTDDLPCPVLRIPELRRQGFEPGRMAMLAGISAGLLEAYDAVMFCDADEFVVADPRTHKSLRHFVAAREGRDDAIGVVGLNIVHDVPREDALRDDEPILGQRRLAKFLPLMCKPSLKSEPAAWMQGSHGITCPYRIDRELLMFHMKFADRDHLAAISAHRHHLNVTQGRATGTSWTRTGDEMVALLDEITTDLDIDAVPEFEAKGLGLKKIVKRRGEMWKATGDGQVAAMRNRPMVRVPERFLGLL